MIRFVMLDEMDNITEFKCHVSQIIPKTYLGCFLVSQIKKYQNLFFQMNDFGTKSKMFQFKSSKTKKLCTHKERAVTRSKSCSLPHDGHGASSQIRPKANAGRWPTSWPAVAEYLNI